MVFAERFDGPQWRHSVIERRRLGEQPRQVGLDDAGFGEPILEGIPLDGWDYDRRTLGKHAHCLGTRRADDKLAQADVLGISRLTDEPVVCRGEPNVQSLDLSFALGRGHVTSVRTIATYHNRAADDPTPRDSVPTRRGARDLGPLVSHSG